MPPFIPGSRPVRTVLCWVLAASMGTGLCQSLRAAVDPAEAARAIAETAAYAKSSMSPEGRQAHEAEISQALVQITDLASKLAPMSAESKAADAKITRAESAVQSAQRDLDAYRAQIESERIPLAQQAQAALDRQARWNAQYANKEFTMPEPFNSIQAERQRISDEIDAINAKGEALMNRFNNRRQQLEGIVYSRQQDKVRAVEAREQLAKAQLAQAQQFQSLIEDLTNKLLAWVKENPVPAPGGFNLKDNQALRDLMRAYNQKPEMMSLATDQLRTEYAPAKAASNVVFDRGGGAEGDLVAVFAEGRVSVPPEMQKNEAVNAMVTSLAKAQDAVGDAQKQWDALIRDRAATPQQIREADLTLTKVTNNLVQLKYEQRQATSLLGRRAPSKP